MIFSRITITFTSPDLDDSELLKLIGIFEESPLMENIESTINDALSSHPKLKLLSAKVEDT